MAKRLECANFSNPPAIAFHSMKIRAGPIVAWVAFTGALCAQTANAEPLSLKLSREIEASAPAPVSVTPGTVVGPVPVPTTRE